MPSHSCNEAKQPKKKTKESSAKKRVIIDFRGEERIIRHRNRLRRIETSILEAEFKKNPVWSNEQQHALAELLNVPKRKVYKWGYERKKKERKR